jgi:hypothetical protein
MERLAGLPRLIVKRREITMGWFAHPEFGFKV